MGTSFHIRSTIYVPTQAKGFSLIAFQQFASVSSSGKLLFSVSNLMTGRIKVCVCVCNGVCSMKIRIRGEKERLVHIYK